MSLLRERKHIIKIELLTEQEKDKKTNAKKGNKWIDNKEKIATSLGVLIMHQPLFWDVCVFQLNQIPT